MTDTPRVVVLLTEQQAEMLIACADSMQVKREGRWQHLNRVRESAIAALREALLARYAEVRR